MSKQRSRHDDDPLRKQPQQGDGDHDEEEDGDEEEELERLEASLHERNWAVLAHVGGLLGSLLVPLIIWLMKREDSAL